MNEQVPSRTPVERLTQAASDAIHVRRVFGDPVTSGDTTVIPVATVLGMHGMGFGEGDLAGRGPESESSPGGEGRGAGGGGGFGMLARPAGAFVVSGDDVTWRPSVDVNLVVLGGQALGAVALAGLTFVLVARALRGRR
ncbi:conserved hypothetical protein [Beutenbergia cavernae DSM 12333]|uniref:Sporulation protein YtfJ n=1 Tax=Beutenbergia cavernae (strain ATCC BAA-8 / DSM 12333 / CCUG 43141 / JCM 11478 / NBRC 16432 / NCIMB 13614 / HKI 0122) TaxID=471853 RepID=C5BW36_BEUC1|nr:hypothetical protein [Beutenbergia cavernae]ACQ80637.1 conserved hypothetical protein [Beutenbergia cavernae DSM 12333]